MRLLLDTHIILWMLGKPAALSKRARDLLENLQNEIFFSPISLFEIAVKAKRRSDFRADPQEVHALLLVRGVHELPLSSEQAVLVPTLPSIHSDPFDRLLLCQAIAQDMILLTADDILCRYSSNVMDAR